MEAALGALRPALPRGSSRPRGPAPRGRAGPRRWPTPRGAKHPALWAAAAALRDRGRPPRVTYSRKVFIPLTNLCRDVCSYCTFATPRLIRGPTR